MQEITNGVYSLSLEFEHEGRERTLWPAVFETDEGLLLVDTGLPTHYDSLTDELAEAGFQVEDIDLVLLTHHDVDHAGTVKYIVADTSATVLAHTDEAEFIAEKAVPVDIEIVDNERIRTTAGKLEIIATPGHTSGHISVYCPGENLLVAADALSGEDGFGGPRPDVSADMETAIESVGRLAQLDVERTLCYHGGLIEHDSSGIQSIYDEISSNDAP